MPRGLEIAAAWSWRVILVVVLLWGIVWLARYLSEVFIPVAVAILLTALMLPVANALKRGRWGLPRAAATAITVIGAVAAIVGVLIVIGGQIAGQGSELSANVVNGFNQLSDWLNNGPLTEWLREWPAASDAAWLDSSTWVTRITDFLRESGSAIATYAAEFGAQVGHFLAGLALALFALFYFIYDGRGIFTFLLNFIPRASRDRVDQAAVRGWRSLSSYVRATILVALFDSIGVLIVALILGVPVAPGTGGAGLHRRLRPDRRGAGLGFRCRARRPGRAWLGPGADHAWRRHPGDADRGPCVAAVPSGTGGEVASAGCADLDSDRHHRRRDRRSADGSTAAGLHQVVRAVSRWGGGAALGSGSPASPAAAAASSALIADRQGF